MKSRKVIVLIVLLLFSAYLRIQRVDCHYAWLDISPKLVMQGGEFQIKYNISKFFASPTGGVVIARREMRAINISLEIPPGMNCTIEMLEVRGNGTIKKEIKGLNIMIETSGDIGSIDLVATVQVPLDFEVGTYGVRVKASALEIDEEGNELYPIDYSISENVEVRTFGPIFSIRAEPDEIEPPFTVGVIVTILHDKPVPPFDIVNLTLRVFPPPPNKPQELPLMDIFGRSILRPGSSIRFPRPVYVDIYEETPGGIQKIRAELEFWVQGIRKVVEVSTNVTIMKKTEVNLTVDVPSEVVNGSEIRLNLEVVNVGSFIAKNVIVLGQIGEEKSVVEIGDLKPGEYRNVEMPLLVYGAGNETLLLKVYWNNEYPHDQVSNSFEFLIFVKSSKFNVKLLFVTGSLVLVAILGWLFGKKTIKRSASS
jgi:hypothetical protein